MCLIEVSVPLYSVNSVTCNLLYGANIQISFYTIYINCIKYRDICDCLSKNLTYSHSN